MGVEAADGLRDVFQDGAVWHFCYRTQRPKEGASRRRIGSRRPIEINNADAAEEAAVISGMVHAVSQPIGESPIAI